MDDEKQFTRETAVEDDAPQADVSSPAVKKPSTLTDPTKPVCLKCGRVFEGHGALAEHAPKCPNRKV